MDLLGPFQRYRGGGDPHYYLNPLAYQDSLFDAHPDPHEDDDGFSNRYNYPLGDPFAALVAHFLGNSFAAPVAHSLGHPFTLPVAYFYLHPPANVNHDSVANPEDHRHAPAYTDPYPRKVTLKTGFVWWAGEF